MALEYQQQQNLVKMAKKEHNCYDCVFRGKVPGSAHSSCNVLSKDGKSIDPLAELALATGIAKIRDEQGRDAVKLDPIGIQGGWAMWPINFDPVWVDSCAFYKSKESMNDIKEAS